MKVGLDNVHEDIAHVIDQYLYPPISSSRRGSPEAFPFCASRRARAPTLLGIRLSRNELAWVLLACAKHHRTALRPDAVGVAR